MVWNAHRAWAEVMRIFTEVRGIGILRSSPAYRTFRKQARIAHVVLRDDSTDLIGLSANRSNRSFIRAA